MVTHSSILAQKIPWTEELACCSPWGLEESDTTEHLSTQVRTGPGTEPRLRQGNHPVLATGLLWKSLNIFHCFLKKKFFFFFNLSVWLHQVFVAACRIFYLPCGMQGLQMRHVNSQSQHVGSSSLTVDPTKPHCIGRSKSQPLDLPGKSLHCFLIYPVVPVCKIYPFLWLLRIFYHQFSAA